MLEDQQEASWLDANLVATLHWMNEGLQSLEAWPAGSKLRRASYDEQSRPRPSLLFVKTSRVVAVISTPVFLERVAVHRPRTSGRQLEGSARFAAP
jgi:hypothetical protein